jgi:hypothetical protein
MSDETPSPDPAFPTAADLCVHRPLYAPFEVPQSQKNNLYGFITSNYQIDTFCPWCAQPTVLLGGKFDVGVENYNFDNGVQEFFMT